MITGKNYYQVLGIRRDADEATIKAAYRQLARQYHPDSHNFDPQSEIEFHEIDAAYEVLRDSIQRAKYDATLDAIPTPIAPSSQAWRYEHRPTPTRNAPSDSAGQSDMWEVFSYVVVVACCVMFCGMLIWLTGVLDTGATTRGWSKTTAYVDRAIATSCESGLGTCQNIFYHYLVGDQTFQGIIEKTGSTYDVGDQFTIEYKDENPERNVVTKPRAAPPNSGTWVIVFATLVVVIFGVGLGVSQISSDSEIRRVS